MNRSRPKCAWCDAPAAEYDPATDNCYCTACALRIVLHRWEARSDDEKLDEAGFEHMDPDTIWEDVGAAV